MCMYAYIGSITVSFNPVKKSYPPVSMGPAGEMESKAVDNTLTWSSAQAGAPGSESSDSEAGMGEKGKSCSLVKVEEFTPWEETRHGRDIDRSWAWPVLLASWMAQVISGGAASSIGTFHLFLMSAFDGDPTLTSAIGSLFSGLCMCIGPLASIISDVSSVRSCMLLGGIVASAGMIASSEATSFSWIFGTFGIVSGFGLGLTFTPSVVIPGYYFVRRRSMACGIGVTGYSFGIIVVPLILRALEEQYGWRGAFLVMGGLTLNLCVCGIIMQPSILEKSRGKTIQKERMNMESGKPGRSCGEKALKKYGFLTNMRFWALFQVFFLSNVSMNIIFLYLPLYADSMGATREEMSSLYIILGFFNMLSRVLVGLGTNDTGRGTHLDKTCVLFGSLSLQSIAILTFPWYSFSTAGRLVFAAIVGFYYGVQPSVTTPLTVDTVGLRKISPAVGMIMFGKGLGMVVGPPLATSLVNFTGDYRHTFILGGIINAASAVVCLLMTTCAYYTDDSLGKETPPDPRETSGPPVDT